MPDRDLKPLNWMEERLLRILGAGGDRASYTIRELAREAFPGVRPVTKADSKVRNALRRPVARGLVERLERGLVRSMPQPYFAPAPPAPALRRRRRIPKTSRKVAR